MSHWIKPFAMGLLCCAALVAAAWFSPLYLPESIPVSVFLPERVNDELFQSRLLARGKDAVQSALLFASAAVGISYVVVALFHLVRPTGPGDAASGWRHVVFWVFLAFALVASGAGAYVALGVWFQDGSEDIALKWSLYVAIGSAALFWLISGLCTESMMRPAIPLRSRVPV